MIKRRVSVFPGGGIFGIISINAVRHFLKSRGLHSKTAFTDFFDATCGVSIGSLFAGTLSLGKSVDEIREFFAGDWQKFNKNFRLFQSLYTMTPVEKRLKKEIGRQQFAMCKIPTLILRLNRLEKRLSWASHPGNDNTAVLDAIISSCSEPAVFPSYYPQGGGCYGGGGLSIYNEPIFAGVQFADWLKEKGIWDKDDEVKYYVFATGSSEADTISMKEAKRTDTIWGRTAEVMQVQFSSIEKDILKLATILGIDYNYYTMRKPDYGMLSFVKDGKIQELDKLSDLYYRQFFNLEEQ